MKNLLLLSLLLLISSCGVDIANDDSNSNEDNSIDVDNSTNGIYVCSYECELDNDEGPTGDSYAESFEIEGGPEDCIKLVSELPQSCAIIEEEPEVVELIVPEEPEADEPDDGFTF